MTMTEARNSDIKNKNGKDVMVHSPLTEGFHLLVHENNIKRWTARVPFCKEKGDWNHKLPTKKTKAERGENGTDPMHDGKWSSANCGRENIETWAPEGMDALVRYTEGIRKERKDNAADYVGLEKDFLAMLQESKPQAVPKNGNGKRGSIGGRLGSPKKQKDLQDRMFSIMGGNNSDDEMPDIASTVTGSGSTEEELAQDSDADAGNNDGSAAV